jgi:5-methyltetrahydropteroyltriglutamate--homocysteine methyltransferase
MSMSTNPPFRAEHVGSLLRPPELRQAFRQFSNGEIDAPAFTAIQNGAIEKAVRMQEAIGFGLATDGEFRRASYWSPVIDAVEGLTVRPASFSFRDGSGETLGFIAPYVEGKLRRRRGITTADYAFLAKTARSAVPKITLPTPSTFHFWRGPDGYDRAAYDDPAELLDDVATVVRAELAELAALGCRYVQFDEVSLIMLADPDIRRTVSERGEDPDRLVGLYIEAINAAVAGRPADVRIGLHMCRGNFKGKFLSAGGYDAIAERVFGETAIDILFLEYDSERAGDFGALKYVPPQKSVVLGLISSKTPALEGKADLHRRIDEAARVVPLDRLAISPQCGFASAASGNPVTPADQEAKLRLVIDVAREVWGKPST